MQKQAIPVSGGSGFSGRLFSAVRGNGSRQTMDHFLYLKEF